jgi:hypothetical protein
MLVLSLIRSILEQHETHKTTEWITKVDVKGERWRHATKRRAQIILDCTKKVMVRLYTE